MTETHAPLLEIWTLGRLEIRLRGALLRGFATRKAEALLVYLVCHAGRSLARAHLQAVFWSERSDQQANASLRQALANLRRLLPPEALVLAAQSVAWSSQVPYWLDVEQIDKDPSLYQGEFLAGLTLSNAAGWDEWLGVQREAITLRLLHCLETGAGEAVRQRRFDEAVRAYQRMLEIEPWRESVHAHLMRLYALQGDRAAALAQYERCRMALAQGLAVLPSPELETLLARIQLGAPTVATPLPHFATPFIGRQLTRKRLAARLADASCRLITLVGPGGSGKTRLAVQVAEENAFAFLHGVAFVPLVALTESAALPTAIAAACGLALRGVQPPLAQVCDYLRDREQLLVLDAFEQFVEKAEAIGAVAQILQAAPQVKLLVTSQVYLNIAWEWLVEVDGLAFAADTPQAAANDRAATHDAITLFVYHARRVWPNFELDEETAACVAHICRLVHGLPLALELAAAALRLFTCAEIAENIAQQVDFLAGTAETSSTRPHSLRAVFDYSWGLLDEAEQAALARCATFRGSFTHAAARQIAEASRQVLAGLERKSFVRRLPEGRLDIHPVLQRFAAEQLQRNPTEAQATQARHATYFLNFLAERGARLHSDRAVLEEVSHELDEVRAAWVWALSAGDLPLLAASVEGWVLYFNNRAWYREGLHGLSAALAALEAAGEAWRGHLLVGLGLASMLLRNLGRLAQEQEVTERRVALYRQQGDPRELFYAIHNLAEIVRLAGDFDRARQLCDECLALVSSDDARVNSDRRCHAETQHLCGVLAATVGDHAAAIAHFEVARDHFAAIHRTIGEVMCQSELGVVYHRLGNLLLARYYFEQSRAGFAAIGYLRGVVVSEHDLARLLLQQGEWEAARTVAVACRRAFRQMDYAFGLAYVLQTLGELATAAGQETEARAYFAEMLAIAADINVPLRQIELLVGLLAYWRKADAATHGCWLAEILYNHPASPFWVRQAAATLLVEDGLPSISAPPSMPTARQVVAEATARLSQSVSG